MLFKTPILFLIFNRPELTRQVFEEIKKQKPKYLFVAADGARANNMDDIRNCKSTRDLVLEGIDWDCEVKTLFRNENLGCGIAVSQAISWFFDHVEQGIILEDDCLPNSSFFVFCESLLEKYKENEKVFGISGNNFQNGIQRGEASYFFSNYSHIWGWASWKRAWKHYDFNLSEWEEFKLQKRIKKIDKRIVFEKYWMPIFDKMYHKEIDTWDYQWQFALWNNEASFVVPNVNLISNIGFGNQATHTIQTSPLSNLKSKDIGQITSLKKHRINKKADRYNSANVYGISKNESIIFVNLQLYLKRKLVNFFRVFAKQKRNLE